MRVWKLDPAHIDAAAIDEAASIIRRGGLVAFPTETVYGLGADATNANAVAGIFRAKGRPSYNPLIVHVGSTRDAARWVRSWPEHAERLAARYWPGPLTLVLPRQPMIPDIVTAGLPSVGVRMPAHPVALALIRAAGVPIAAPSANRSMHVSPTIGEHVVESLGEEPDLVLDAGPAAVGIESTVLDLSSPIPTLLRPGMISADELRQVVGRVEIAASAADGTARPSPGMMDRHYSPKATLSVHDTSRELIHAATDARSRGAKALILSRSPIDETSLIAWRMPESAAEFARELYGVLYRADAAGFDEIVVEAVPAGAEWDGIRDRLRRAAG